MDSVTRRSFTVGALSSGVIAGGPVPLLAQTGAAAREVVRFGGGGGAAFPRRFVTSLGITESKGGGGSGVRLASLYLNDRRFGYASGNLRGELFFENGEYIDSFVLRSSRGLIDRFWLTTNKGRRIRAGGWNNDATEVRRSGVRVSTIGGRSGGRIDRLEIEYVANYVPSRRIAVGETAVLEFIPPNSSFERTERTVDKRLETFRRLFTRTEIKSRKANIGVELLEVLSLGGEFSTQVTSTDTLEMTRQIERVLETSRKHVFATGENYAFVIAPVDVHRDADGVTFVVPTSIEATVVYTPGEYDRLLGYINLYGPVADVIGQRSEADPAIGGLERLRPVV
ncbi:hypothetical protein [Rubrimonas sp.]|uniref:hypothetical protein n=1 Tax=Rubrimonas sp. TaxID=2036015 RepID=UPI002FDDD1E8